MDELKLCDEAISGVRVEKCLEYLPLKLGGLTISWRNRKESFLPLGSSPLLACEILHILTHICLFYFIDIY